mmetsp:Transcript_4097/g.7480  ORF Transcript_4097/g.7480 Transcript_4097/m.7480 type:complete len:339 (-) Transcript_4097:45-1061(-)
MYGQLAVRYGGQVLQVPCQGHETAGELQVAILIHAAGLTDRLGNPCLPDAEAAQQLPVGGGLPEGSCEFRLWCQMVPLPWGHAMAWPSPGQARIFDLRRSKAAPRCQSSSAAGCLRCEKLASGHALTSRWLRFRKEAAEAAALAAAQASKAPLVVHIRSDKRIAPLVLFGNDSGEVPAAAAIAAFALRQAASVRWPQCPFCRRLRSCAEHLEKLREELLPAAVPAKTCCLQLWVGFKQLQLDEDLAAFRDPERGRVDVVAKVDPKSPNCQGAECPRCALLADAEPVSAALRRRRHFWRRKRAAFLLRFGETQGKMPPLVVFLQRTCPETTFHLIVTFL